MGKQQPRNTTRYRVEDGDGNEVWVGITKNPEEREQAHQRRFGEDAELIREGPRVTRETARKWEKEQATKGRRTRSGQ